MSKHYMGDGVYAEVTDHGDIVITTEDGISVTNRIILEQPGVSALSDDEKDRWSALYRALAALEGRS